MSEQVAAPPRRSRHQNQLETSKKRHRVGKTVEWFFWENTSLISSGRAQGGVLQAEGRASLLKAWILIRPIPTLSSLAVSKKFTLLTFVTIVCLVSGQWERERAWRTTKRKEGGNKLEGKRERKEGNRYLWSVCFMPGGFTLSHFVVSLPL